MKQTVRCRKPNVFEHDERRGWACRQITELIRNAIHLRRMHNVSSDGEKRWLGGWTRSLVVLETEKKVWMQEKTRAHEIQTRAHGVGREVITDIHLNNAITRGTESVLSEIGLARLDQNSSEGLPHLTLCSPLFRLSRL